MILEATTKMLKFGEIYLSNPIKKWMNAPFLLNFYPCLITVILGFLLFLMPVDVLSRFPILYRFTNILGEIVPGIPVFSSNTGLESVLFVHSVMWAIVPIWIPLYNKYFPLLDLPYEHAINYLKLNPKAKKYLVLGPFLLFAAAWSIWSGFLFEGGEPTIVKGLVFGSLVSSMLWSYFLTHAFLSCLWGGLTLVLIYPTILKSFFLKAKND